MNNMQPAEMSLLLDSYPHLEEKAIVDFINSFSVMSDHLNEKRRIANSGRSARLFDRLTGDSAKRQELIDGSVESSFIFIKDYVVSNERRLAKNEYFLHQVMDGVSLISEKLQEVAGDTRALRENLTELGAKVNEMDHSFSQRLDYQDLHNSAMSEMNLAVSVFAKSDVLFSPEQSLWMLLTRLKYGEFGGWVAIRDGGSKHEKIVQAAMQQLKNDSLRILAEQTGRSTNELVDRQTLFARLSSDDDLLRDALCLVSEHRSNTLEPIILAVNSGGCPDPSADLPYVFSNASIYEEMSHLLEQGENYAAS